MLEMHWEFVPRVRDRVGEFSLGDLTLRGARGEVTSKGRAPNQSMMVFLSIVLMLDGIRDFIEKREAKRTLDTVGSSFMPTLTRAPDGRIAVAARGVEVDTVTEDELVRAAWDGAQALLREHRDAVGTTAGDLEASEESFRSAFGL